MKLFFIFLSVLLLGTFTWFTIRFSARYISTKIIIPALALKILAGIGVGLLYKYHYNGGDTFHFFNESIKLSTLFRQDASAYFQFLMFNQGNTAGEMIYQHQPRALFFTKLLSIVNLFTHDSYWLSSVFFSLFCFAGLAVLARRLVRIYPRKDVAIFISLLFFPSVVFWSSGILKETIALGAIGLLLASFLGYLFQQKKITIAHLLFDLLMAYLLWSTKYYYAGLLLWLMISVALTLVLVNKSAFLVRSRGYQVVLFFFISMLLLIFVSKTHPNFYLNRMPAVIVDNYYTFAERSAPEDIIHYNNLAPTWKSILINSPKALVSGLFRPFIGEGDQLIKSFAGAENVMLLLLFISAFFKVPTGITPKTRLLLSGAMMYFIGLSTFLALSAPNFGTLVRYKVGFLPVLLLVLTFGNPLIEKLNKLIK